MWRICLKVFHQIIGHDYTIFLSHNFPENEVHPFFDKLKRYYFYQKDLIELNANRQSSLAHTFPLNNTSTLSMLLARQREVIELQQKHFDKQTAESLFYESNQTMKYMVERQLIMTSTKLSSSERSSALAQLKQTYLNRAIKLSA